MLNFLSFLPAHLLTPSFPHLTHSATDLLAGLLSLIFIRQRQLKSCVTESQAADEDRAHVLGHEAFNFGLGCCHCRMISGKL